MTTVRRTLANTSAHQLDRRREHRRAQGHLDRRRDGHRQRPRAGRREAHPPHVHHGQHHDARRGQPSDRPDARRPGRGRRDTRAAGTTTWSRLDDTYAGDATYTANVPRDQRHAVGTTSERYRLYGSGGCYDRVLGTAQDADAGTAATAEAPGGDAPFCPGFPGHRRRGLQRHRRLAIVIAAEEVRPKVPRRRVPVRIHPSRDASHAYCVPRCSRRSPARSCWK